MDGIKYLIKHLYQVYLGPTMFIMFCFGLAALFAFISDPKDFLKVNILYSLFYLALFLIPVIWFFRKLDKYAKSLKNNTKP